MSITREERRKPVKSHHNSVHPLQLENNNNRKRIDSNYSVKSGGDTLGAIVSVTQDNRKDSSK